MKALLSRSLACQAVSIGASITALVLSAPMANATNLDFITGTVDEQRSFVINFNCGIQGRAPAAGGGTLGVCEPVIGNASGVTNPSDRMPQTVARLFINQYSDQARLNQAALFFETLQPFYGEPNDQADSADELLEVALNIKEDNLSFLNSFGFLAADGVTLEQGSGPGKIAGNTAANAVEIKSYGQAAGRADAFDLLLRLGKGSNGLVIPEPGEAGNPRLLGAITFADDFAPSILFNESTRDGFPRLLAAYKLTDAISVIQEKSDRDLLQDDADLGLLTGSDRTRDQNFFGAAANPQPVPLESDLAGLLGIGGLACWTYRRSRRGAEAELQLD